MSQQQSQSRDHQIERIGPGFTVSWVKDDKRVKMRVGYDLAKKFAEKHGLEMPEKR